MADIQNVAIERKTLLGVEPLPQTNLVEMVAQGENGDVLPTLVSTWIEVYLEVRAEEIEQTKQRTLKLVEEELAGLAIKLEEARDSLERYREENGII